VGIHMPSLACESKVNVKASVDANVKTDSFVKENIAGAEI
jgi:hypothetical protein